MNATVDVGTAYGGAHEKLAAHPEQLPPADVRHQWHSLPALYGVAAAPDILLTCLNGGAGSLEHFGSSHGARGSVVSRAIRELQRRCMRPGEKPATTRV